MEFFEKIKKHFLKYNLLFAIMGLFLLLTSGMSNNTVERNIQLFIIILSVTIYNIYAIFTKKEYKQFMEYASNIGDIETIGASLASTKPSIYAIGDLRFNESFLFYTDKEYIAFVTSASIERIEISPKRPRESCRGKFITVTCINTCLYIRGPKKHLYMLLDEMNKTLEKIKPKENAETQQL